MLVSLVPGGSLSLVAVCQVSHKLATTRDTRVTLGKRRIMKEARRFRQEGGEWSRSGKRVVCRVIWRWLDETPPTI